VIDLAKVHDDLRPLMFSIAYRMLGSVTEAEQWREVGADHLSVVRCRRRLRRSDGAVHGGGRAAVGLRDRMSPERGSRDVGMAAPRLHEDVWFAAGGSLTFSEAGAILRRA
jgi:hypothetical protein